MSDEDEFSYCPVCKADTVPVYLDFDQLLNDIECPQCGASLVAEHDYSGEDYGCVSFWLEHEPRVERACSSL